MSFSGSETVRKRNRGVPRDLGPLFIVHGSVYRFIDGVTGVVYTPIMMTVRVPTRFLERYARLFTIHVRDIKILGGNHS